MKTMTSLKTILLAAAFALGLGASPALAHSNIEIGPNGGRILEFSKDETLHGEVTLKDGYFHVALLDKDMKPVDLKDQVLVVTGGDRSRPEKPAVERKDGRFVFPALQGKNYLLVLQYKERPSAKAIVARFEYDATVCSSCKNGEWLCSCASEETKAKAKK